VPERAELGILLVGAGCGALFVYQQKLIAKRERDACFKAFMNNNYVGLVLFLGLAMSYLLHPGCGVALCTSARLSPDKRSASG
jgi:hypothetical protein